jgi:hypothetical protein
MVVPFFVDRCFDVRDFHRMNTRSHRFAPSMARLTLLALIIVAVLIRCGEDKGGPEPTNTIDGAPLFGLVDGRTMVYLRTDSARDSQFVLHVHETLDTVTISGSGDDWSVTGTGQPRLSLKVTDQYILQNGFWPAGDSASLVYFAVPPVLTPRHLNVSDTWDGYCPYYVEGSDSYQRLFLYSYFGFYFTRTFTGNVALTLPAGSFSAHRIDVQLYQSDLDVDPLANVQEFYVPAVGLVLLSFEAGAFKRVLSLVSYE